MASTCNCCLDRKLESLDHVISSGEVVNMVWKKAVEIMMVSNVVIESWKIKINRLFCGAKENSLKGMLMRLILIIITWRLWNRRCKARMEDKLDSRDIVWISVRYWSSKLLANSKLYISSKETKILVDFHVK